MKPKTKTDPNPAIKKSPAQLSETYNCKICNKKNWLHIPLKNVSRLQCVAKKIFRCKEKPRPPPPAYLMVALLDVHNHSVNEAVN